AARKSPAKTAATKKAAKKAAATKKAATKKAAAKNVATKKTAPRNTSTRKSPAKKVAAGKTAPKKVAARQGATKNTSSKKTATASAAPRKTAARKSGAATARGRKGASITPEQALANTRELLEAKQRQARTTQPWQALDDHAPVHAPEGYQSASAAQHAEELHAAEAQIGRASCRERAEIAEVGVALKEGSKKTVNSCRVR